MPWGKPGSWGVIDLRAGWHTTFQNDLRFLVTSLRPVEGKGPGPNSHQVPPLQCFSEPVRCYVHCNSPRRQGGVPAVSSWLLRPWNSPPPTHTHTPRKPVAQCLQPYFGKRCLRETAVMSKTSLSSHQPRFARLSFENIIQLIRFWRPALHCLCLNVIIVLRSQCIYTARLFHGENQH